MAAPSTSGRLARAGVLALTILIFGVVVAVVTLQLRGDLRRQISRGWAENLAAITSMQLDDYAAELGPEALAGTGSLHIAVLRTQRLRDLAGVRVFDAQGRLAGAFPGPWSEDPPRPDEWTQLLQGEAIVRLHPGVSTDDVVLGLAAPAPGEIAVEAWVPLRRGGERRILGVAQFWMRGNAFAAELAAHDRRLGQHAVIAWLAGSAAIGLTLAWAFGRLDAANRELRARSEDLQRANRELILAAKTSALGAVAAHLMHELKNPIAGLEVIVAGQTDPATRENGGELAAASELTRRLRTMVNDVVGVLRDEQARAEFELTAADVVDLVAEKVRAEAATAGVHLTATGAPDVALAGRRANLAILVLRNLVQNAIEAVPRGATVRLTGRATPEGAVEFLVEDTGPGLPDAVRSRLFQPCASAKPGGSGLGLALSYQIAQHAGGRLELQRSDARGTRFRLVLGAEA